MKRSLVSTILPFSTPWLLLLYACGDDSGVTTAMGGARNAGAPAHGGTDSGEGGAEDGAQDVNGSSGTKTTHASAGDAGASTALGAGGAMDIDVPAEAGAGGEGSCVPRTCEALSACGGQVDDGCGRVLQCPPCGPTLCEYETPLLLSRAAKSSGFHGTREQYTELYSIACNKLSDCETACMERGGTADMCAASECIQSTQNYCLPATAWSNLMALTSTGDDPAQDGAELVLVALPYRDALLAEGFQFELPPAAEVLGIEVTLRRAADFESSAADDAVRLMKNGVATELNRAKPEQWPAGAFQSVTYGGKMDLWGESWTAKELNSGALGVSLTVQYTQSAGNARAYVDLIQAKAFYRAACQ